MNDGKINHRAPADNAHAPAAEVCKLLYNTKKHCPGTALFVAPPLPLNPAKYEGERDDWGAVEDAIAYHDEITEALASPALRPLCGAAAYSFVDMRGAAHLNESVDFVHYRGPATAGEVARRVAAAAAPSLTVATNSTPSPTSQNTTSGPCPPRPNAVWTDSNKPSGNYTGPPNTANMWAIAASTLVPALATEAAVLAAGWRGGGVAAPLVAAGTTAPRGAIAALDGIRVIGAFHIVAFHLYQRVGACGKGIPVLAPSVVGWECSWCGFGKYWVQAFFLISGFVSGLSYFAAAAAKEARGEDPRPAEPLLPYVVKRVVPLYPLYLLGLALALLFRVAFPPGGEVGAWDLASSLLMVQSWAPPFNPEYLNGPAWYLSNMLFFWILFPHWARAVVGMSRDALLGLCVLVYACAFVPTAITYHMFDDSLAANWKSMQPYLEFHPLTNWVSFLLGVLWARVLELRRRDRKSGGVARPAARRPPLRRHRRGCRHRRLLRLRARAWAGGACDGDLPPARRQGRPRPAAAGADGDGGVRCALQRPRRRSAARVRGARGVGDVAAVYPAQGRGSVAAQSRRPHLRQHGEPRFRQHSSQRVHVAVRLAVGVAGAAHRLRPLRVAVRQPGRPPRGVRRPPPPLGRRGVPVRRPQPPAVASPK